MDLNLLVALDALLQERSVTRAGERLSITQPAMSGSLARLRALFNDELFVRVGHSMRPTPFAEALGAPLRALLAQLEDTLLTGAHFDPTTDSRTFTILASDYMSVVVLRPLLARLAGEAPNVRIRTGTDLMIDKSVHRLLQGEADLAFGPPLQTHEPSLSREALFEDRFMVAVWAGNTNVRKRFTRAHLTSLPYLTYGDVRSPVDDHLRSRGLELDPVVITEGFSTGLLLLKGTNLFTFSHELLARALADVAGVRILEPPIKPPPLIETMTWHARLTNDPGHRWLREQIRAVAADLTCAPAIAA